jgi:hypothetical protein
MRYGQRPLRPTAAQKQTGSFRPISAIGRKKRMLEMGSEADSEVKTNVELKASSKWCPHDPQQKPLDHKGELVLPGEGRFRIPRRR